jgi:hypothetical protein
LFRGTFSPESVHKRRALAEKIKEQE